MQVIKNLWNVKVRTWNAPSAVGQVTNLIWTWVHFMRYLNNIGMLTKYSQTDESSFLYAENKQIIPILIFSPNEIMSIC